MTLTDHCRIGSLENNPLRFFYIESDHCRIGSLENLLVVKSISYPDHCRIGSLEISCFDFDIVITRSLPHRQLRNAFRC